MALVKSEHETIHLFSTVVSGVILKLVNSICYFTCTLLFLNGIVHMWW